VAAEADHLAFAYDLTLDEARRRAAIVEAIGDHWDPAEVLAQEDRAYAMLYSDLDDDQQRIYDGLVAAGVLPDRVAGRVPD
jgi:ribonucleotide reductase beta subunit family protein with ferritin-like domain